MSFVSKGDVVITNLLAKIAIFSVPFAGVLAVFWLGGTDLFARDVFSGFAFGSAWAIGLCFLSAYGEKWNSGDRFSRISHQVDSLRNHVDLLRNSRYADIRRIEEDVQSEIRGLNSKLDAINAAENKKD